MLTQQDEHAFRSPISNAELYYYIAFENKLGQIERIIQITDGCYSIGRNPANDIVLNSPEISRTHAKLVLEGNKLSISDVDSKSGIYIDRVKIDKEALISAGSTIQIGSYSLHIDTKELDIDFHDRTVQVLGQAAPGSPLDSPDEAVHVFPLTELVSKPSEVLPATAVAEITDLPTKLIDRTAPGLSRVHTLDDGGTYLGSLIKITDALSKSTSKIHISESYDSGARKPILLTGAEPDNPEDRLYRRYERIKPLAEGAYGSIWVVRERLSGRYAALKVLKGNYLHDELMVSQFMIESIITARLQHPNILPVYDLGFLEHDQLYYTMRLIEGTKVKEILSDPNDQRRAIVIIAQASSAIAYAHRQNLMHLDVKPANLLVDTNDHCYVTDWGLVRTIPGRNYSLEIPDVVLPHIHKLDINRRGLDNDRWIEGTMTRMESYFGNKVAGTWRYMAPEQAGGRPTAASDLWALGLILYEALTGIHPYQLLGLRQDDILAITRITDIPPVEETARRMNRLIVYPKVAAICDRALRKVGVPTFPDVGSFANTLKSAIGISSPAKLRNQADETLPKMKLDLIGELAALPFYAIKRRREIKQQISSLQNGNQNQQTSPIKTTKS